MQIMTKNLLISLIIFYCFGSYGQFNVKGIVIDQGSPKELIEKHGRKNMEEVFLKLTREII